MAKVSVIVLNYNGRDLTVKCLAALEGQAFRDFELIIVDNGSSDDSLRQIESWLEESPLADSSKVLRVGRNVGFAGGNMIGFRGSKGEYVALLNNDAEPHKEWLGNLVKAMEERPEVGICASRMLVSGTNIIDSAGDGFAAFLKGFKRGEGKSSGRYDVPEYVFGACAGAALYRRKMIDDIGFLDEEFFLIHEDTDLNLRAQLSGWKVFYVPSALVYHKVRSAIGHMSDTAVYYTLRNCELVRVKNLPGLFFLKYLHLYLIATVLDFLYFAVRYKRLRLYFRAKIDVLKKLKVMLERRKLIMNARKVDNRYLSALITPPWNKEFFLGKASKFFQG